MATHSLDIPTFRLAFPAFANVTKYPDARLDVTWGMATAYLGDADGLLLNGAGLQGALNFLTAHLLQISTWNEQGNTGAGVVTGSQVDKVSVQFAAPPFKDGWEYWLSLTPYGRELWALLKIKSAGGFFVGGMPERDAFRRVYGGFGQGWVGRRGF